MKHTLFIILASLSICSIKAQSLIECIEYAKANSLRLKVADMQISKTRLLENSHLDIPKTELSLSQDPSSGGSPDNALTLSQQFDYPTVYSNKQKLLKAETKVEESRKLLTMSELTREISIAYSNLLYYMHEQQLLQSNDSVLQEFVRLATVKHNNGEARQLEVLEAERVLAENSLAISASKNLQKVAQMQLRGLLNTDRDIIPTDSYQNVKAIYSNLDFDNTPQGIMLESERQLSQQALTCVKQELLPTFNVGLRYQLLIGAINPYNIERERFTKGDWMGFEIGVAVPLFRGAQRAKAKSVKQELNLIAARQEAARQEADTQLGIAMQQMLTADKNNSYYQNEGLASAKELRRLSTVEYQNGEINYTEYIQSLLAAINTEILGAKAIDELNKAIIDFNYIKGL